MLVVGGGLGGVVAVIALRQAGLDAVVFEAARSVEDVLRLAAECTGFEEDRKGVTDMEAVPGARPERGGEVT
ncbi:MAG: hypothetical protein WD080_00300 [Egibacteraceae bacterium]